MRVLPRRGRKVAGLVVIAACVDLALLALSVSLWMHPRVHSAGLTALLLIAGVVAGMAVVPRPGQNSITASFLVVLLAATISSPGVACLVAATAEITAAIRLRSPAWGVLINLCAVLAPAVLAALMIQALAPGHAGSADLYIAAGLAGCVYVCLNFAIVSGSIWIDTRESPLTLRVFLAYLPSQAITVALALVAAGFYYKVGIAGVALVLVAVFAFSYMAQLLEQSRERAQQYVALSWGVLAGLMRSLDVRDAHAARHAAAVAGFARDIARESGFSERECELAHTAGLLHDIGRFALSDRVAERGRELTEDDWAAIHRHPELGADLLKDLGMYGPVGDIVLAHHERIDGLGYPRGLRGEEIPELSKIVAVAEVYDTLTARDTYRTPMSSFEALRELRRVAGSQLDAGYVETFATLLGREDYAYRHRDGADFDTELGIERRIGEAAAGA